FFSGHVARTNRFAAPSGEERLPDAAVDVAGQRPGRAVAEDGVHAAIRVVRPGVDLSSPGVGPAVVRRGPRVELAPRPAADGPPLAVAFLGREDCRRGAIREVSGPDATRRPARALHGYGRHHAAILPFR